MTMKVYEDMGPDRKRLDDFETDDEDNEAETLGGSSNSSSTCGGEEDSGSHCGLSSRNSSDSPNGSYSALPWPQSYRQTMDMYTSVTPPAINFLAGTSVGISSSFLSSVYRRSQVPEPDASLSKPLISDAGLDLELPASSLKSSISSYSKLSVCNELPPVLEKCSFSQSVINDSASTLSHNVYLFCFNRDMEISRRIGYVDKQSSAPGSNCMILTREKVFKLWTECFKVRGGAILKSIGTNILCGIGLLTTPYAIRETGWSSLLLLTVFGIICCYTGILLKQCLESRPGLQTYPDIGKAAFGNTGRIIIAIILYVELYATCVEFVIMMSDNLASLFPNASLDFGGLFLNSHQTFAIGATLIVLPTVWLRNLSLLSYLSAGGVIASLLVVLCLLWVGVVDQVGFHPSGTAINITNLPVSLGLVGFCFAGHSVFPNIYSSMREPAQFSWVLMLSFIICWFLYTGVAVCGFLMFGDSVKSQFTLNMPKKFVASKLALYTTVFCPMSKYALTITPVALSIEELLPQTSRRSHGVSVLIRTVLVISTLIVGMSVPFFGSVMALIGSLLAMFVSIIFPCACYLSILGHRLSILQIAACIITLIVGFLCGCVGTYSAVTRIAGNVS